MVAQMVASNNAWPQIVTIDINNINNVTLTVKWYKVAFTIELGHNKHI